VYAAKHLILGQVFLAYSNSAGEDHRSFTLGLVWHPVGLAQPDHAAAQGQPATELLRALPGSAPGLPRGSPWGGRRDATSCPHPAASMICALAIPEACPPGEGTVLLQVDKIFWDQARLRPTRREQCSPAEIFVEERVPPDAHVFGSELGNRSRAR
jgi:hypothetical protein